MRFRIGASHNISIQSVKENQNYLKLHSSDFWVPMLSISWWTWTKSGPNMTIIRMVGLRGKNVEISSLTSPNAFPKKEPETMTPQNLISSLTISMRILLELRLGITMLLLAEPSQIGLTIAPVIPERKNH